MLPKLPDAGLPGFLSSGAIKLSRSSEVFGEGKAILRRIFLRLTGFSAELTAAWITYMINEVNGHVILSTPLLALKAEGQSSKMFGGF